MSARADLCGGRSVMIVPTATSSSISSMLIFGITRTGLAPRSQRAKRLFVAGSIGGIIGRLDLREALEACCVDFGDPVLEGSALDVVFDLAVAQRAFESDELALLESLRELREIAPGIDAMPSVRVS